MKRTFDHIKHVAIYLRISQEKRGENVETLENHRQILCDFCKENGYTYEEYGEVISGGKSEIEQRKELQLLLEDIEKFDAILCFELTRLSRNGLISQTVKQYCIDYDKPILTPYQSYDLANSETDRLLYDVGSMISSHEHGTIGKRSKANKKQMSKAGLHVSGNVPFGYRRNNETKKLEIYEEEAKVVRYIFKLHSEGLGSFKIRDILNAEGYKSATGKAFELPTIKRIIKNPTYKGTIVFNDRKKVKKNGKFVYEPVETIQVDNAHPAIIPPDEWDRANRERISRAKQAAVIREKPASTTGTTMLKDLVYCGVCGRKMRIFFDDKSSTGYVIQRCYHLYNGEKCPNRGIKLELVEKEVTKALPNFKSLLEKSVQRLQQEKEAGVETDIKRKIKQQERKLNDLNEQQDKLIDLALKGIFNEEEIRNKKQELIDEIKYTESAIVDLKEKIGNIDLNDHINSLMNIIELIEKLPNMEPDEVNQSLKTFISKIVYTRVLPPELLKKSTRNKQRKEYPFEIEIEFIE